MTTERTYAQVRHEALATVFDMDPLDPRRKILAQASADLLRFEALGIAAMVSSDAVRGRLYREVYRYHPHYRFRHPEHDPFRGNPEVGFDVRGDAVRLDGLVDRIAALAPLNVRDAVAQTVQRYPDPEVKDLVDSWVARGDLAVRELHDRLEKELDAAADELIASNTRLFAAAIRHLKSLAPAKDPT